MPWQAIHKRAAIVIEVDWHDMRLKIKAVIVKLQLHIMLTGGRLRNNVVKLQLDIVLTEGRVRNNGTKLQLDTDRRHTEN